jgi:signal peptidase
MRYPMEKISTKWPLRVVKIILNVAFYSSIAILILFSIANTKLKTTGDIANIGGRGFLTVLTGSMDGNEKESFSVDDLVLVRIPSENQKKNLKVGDIVTYFKSNIEGLGRPGLITHRIIEVAEDIDGKRVYVTRGDAAPEMPDIEDNDFISYSEQYLDTISYNDVVGVYTGQIKNLGSTMKTLQTPNGFLMFIVFPVLLLLIVETVFLVKNVFSINKEKLTANLEKEKEEALAKLEAEKIRMREQILEELKKEQK